MSDSHAAPVDPANAPEQDRDVQKKPKNRRPANTAFRQQRLKAWQPILTPKTVIPLFLLVGVIFAPIGALLLYASAQVQEIIIDYSDCAKLAPNSTTQFKDIPADKVRASFKPSNCTSSSNVARWKQRSQNISYGIHLLEHKNTPTTICTLQFVIPNNLNPPVLFYYRLTNFYQNHRRYVKSLDSKQLKGDAVSLSTIKGGSCDPLRVDEKTNRPYYPCGLVANALFNDTFANPVLVNVKNQSINNQTYEMTDKGIAWSSDQALYGKTKYKLDEVAVPPNWIERWPTGNYTEENPFPSLHTDEAFQVWMRSAGLPTFSKLAKRNDHDVMQCGMYQVDIQMNFPVTVYGGTKAIVISTRTIMGGKNPFLGIAYVIVAGICVVLCALFTVTHLIKPRKLGDHTYLTWNNDQPSTATATGISRPGTHAA